MRSRLKKVLLGGSAVAISAIGFVSLGSGLQLLNSPEQLAAAEGWKKKIEAAGGVVPSRASHLTALNGTSPSSPLDLLIIGGGATGCGCALDGATRGLKVGLVERDDFASGTSSRSTKLVHGGVRYLEKAVFHMDLGQLRLVFHALDERYHMLRNAPHLCAPLPTMTPCYELWEIPYYWSGLKLYDLISGRQLLHLSRFYSAEQSKALFPTLSQTDHGRNLKGTVVYYDGQFDDSRFNIALACTAALAGASVLNHAEAVAFFKDETTGRIAGARVRDHLTGREFDVHARVIINAGGPFCDEVRKIADKEAKPLITPSSGVHVVLPDYYSPDGMGLIVPKTKDGRVVFMLPWLGRTVAGTTDSSTKITMLPEPHEEEIQFILDAISDYLCVKVRRSDVLSAWSGIRPLASDPSLVGTENISREHVVCPGPEGLLTITGGKWTTYRSMAEDAVSIAIKLGSLTPANGCVTKDLVLLGGDEWDPALFTVLSQQYLRMKKSYGGKIVPGAMDTPVAKHLAHSYGGLCQRVATIAQEENLGKRIAHGYPYLEAEVAYCARNEYCETAVDFIARRSRLAFLDTNAAGRSLGRVIEILAAEHRWDRSRKKSELARAKAFLETFKSSQNAQFRDGKHN
ncbi:hypothetical protein GOP47_0013570 [Adiantum capillus-veneris]|uniref:Glycerol-3-phosphate dehydrogenase n=1 Tax=Adiantum capillus-veneris TaxID=13818 RepID=A0A9D4ZDI4_ADICA|nr:hypothetical protein GOP47_0013570 [Adiantum capillus-veneris]